MENDVKQKNNIGVVIVISLLSILVILLGFYFISHEFLTNNEKEKEKENIIEKDNTNTQEKDDTNTQEKDEGENTKEYTFETNKIVNIDNTYVYNLKDLDPNNNSYSYSYEKLSNGYKFCSNGICEELNGEFTEIIKSSVFKGGAGMGDGYYFLVSKNGDLYYANEADVGKIKIGIITKVKNVVKLYAVNLTSDRIVSPDGETVVAQTKDGSLYDLYEYVK